MQRAFPSRSAMPIFGICLLMSLSACDQTPHQPTSSCDVATAFAEMVITDLSARRVVFSDEPGNLSPQLEQRMSAIPAAPTARALPPARLLSQFKRIGETNALSDCASLTTFLANQHIQFGPQAVQQAQSQNADGVLASSIVWVSRAELSSDGQQALIGSTIISGVLDGAGMLFLLQRQPSGRWQVIAEYQIFVS